MQGYGKLTLFNLIDVVDGIPKLIYNGTEGDYNVIVMDLFGPNLDDLMSYCEPGLSIKSVVLIADQLVRFALDLHGIDSSLAIDTPTRLHT